MCAGALLLTTFRQIAPQFRIEILPRAANASPRGATSRASELVGGGGSANVCLIAVALCAGRATLTRPPTGANMYPYGSARFTTAEQRPLDGGGTLRSAVHLVGSPRHELQLDVGASRREAVAQGGSEGLVRARVVLADKK